MAEIMLPLPGLSPVNGNAVAARFDGGALTSDAGLLALREVERRLDVAGRLATGIDDLRDPLRTVHSVADILRFRMLLIAAGYEDGIDANALRSDPVFKLALERLPGERDLCSQSTISRLENLPDRRMLLRMGRAMIKLYCASLSRVPKRITLDIDDTSRSSSGGSASEGAGARRRRRREQRPPGLCWQPVHVPRRPVRDRLARRRVLPVQVFLTWTPLAMDDRPAGRSWPRLFQRSERRPPGLRWTDQALAPTLRPGDVIVTDNLSDHKVTGVLKTRLIPLTQVALDVVWRLPGGPGRVGSRG